MLFLLSAVQLTNFSGIIWRFCCQSTLFARRGETGEIFFWLVIFGVFIGIICVVSYAATQFTHKWKYNSHPSLFYSLCRIHDIDRSTRSMLKQVIRHHGMTQPARLFTEPQWLDPAKLGKAFEAKSQQILALRKRIFAIDQDSTKSL
ncbi:MAG: hypothetical protein JXM70_25205 [Pirellulales bacterium]|nr:hypothetical protein [Pirellulales bacterium]